MNAIRIVAIMHTPESLAAISNVLATANDINIVETAHDLQQGIDKIRLCSPEIIIVQDNTGIVKFTSTVLRFLPETGIIIVTSGNTLESAQRVIDSLSAGAFDFVAGLDKLESISSLLLSKIRCCSIKRYSSMARKSESGNVSVLHKETISNSVTAASLSTTVAIKKPVKKFKIILIGVSTGGPEALMRILPKIPENISVPIVIVLHMPREFTGHMAAALDKKTAISSCEVHDGQEIKPGIAYLAPGGFHCSLKKNGCGQIYFCITDGPAENGCKPSVDVLFRSAAEIYGENALSIILTGMGNDGAKGAGVIKQQGGFVIVQDEQTSVVWGMPGSVVRAGFANEIIPLDEISARITELVGVVS